MVLYQGLKRQGLNSTGNIGGILFSQVVVFPSFFSLLFLFEVNTFLCKDFPFSLIVSDCQIRHEGHLGLHRETLAKKHAVNLKVQQ